MSMPASLSHVPTSVVADVVSALDEWRDSGHELERVPATLMIVQASAIDLALAARSSSQITAAVTGMARLMTSQGLLNRRSTIKRTDIWDSFIESITDDADDDLPAPVAV